MLIQWLVVAPEMLGCDAAAPIEALGPPGRAS
jgi:hypothetical protein